MLEPLEQIVKIYVPFVGIRHIAGFDGKGRITIPNSFINTFMERQEVEDKIGIRLYYKLQTREKPNYIELTDYFPNGEHIEFWAYERLSVDKSSRILIPQSNLIKVDMQRRNTREKYYEIVFEGNGNRILIYRADDYTRDEIWIDINNTKIY